MNFSETMNITLSANERVALTGSSVMKGNKEGAKLMGFDTLTGEQLCSEPIVDANQSINQVHWATQQGTNTIFVGTSSGDIKVLYEPKVSREDIGILRCVQKRQ